MQIDSNSLFADFTQRLAKNGSEVQVDSTQERPNFEGFLLDGLQKVNQSQATSEAQIETLMTGGEIDAAEVITSMQKADMAFRLLIQVRNKVMRAYEEIQSIQV